MIKNIDLLDKVDNNDGTTTMIAELKVYTDDMIFSYDASRSIFTFSNSMTDDEIKDYLIINDYSIYY